MEIAASIAGTNCQIKASKEYPLPHTKYLVGARVYDAFEKGFLMPYIYIYSEILSQLLLNADISTPGYKEIYFSINSTMDGAKSYRSYSKGDFYKYTYCTIDPTKYQQSSPSEKDHMVLTALCEGLRYITEFDHLDRTKIEKVIAEVSLTGIETAPLYLEKENKQYQVQIHFKVNPNVKNDSSFFATIINKSTAAKTVKFLGNVDPWWRPFRKVKILKDKVVIQNTDSGRGEWIRNTFKLLDKFEFDLNEIA